MNLVQLDINKINDINNAWIKSAIQFYPDLGQIELEQFFAVIKDNGAIGELKDNKSVYFSVEEDDKTHALVEIIQSKKGKEVWIKMMDITLCPELEFSIQDDRNTTERLTVFVTALIGIFSLTKGVTMANTVKVYGRTELLLTFLRGMHDSIKTVTELGTIQGVSVSIEGRWLVFRAKA